MSNIKPKVSVITSTYNDLTHLKKVINIICSQDYENIELIVVDGNSNDGTKEYLNNLKPKLASFKFISEKDNGIYDALNKGIELASGEIIGCCYDYYQNNHVLSTIVEQMNLQNVDAIHGDLVYVDNNDKVVRKWHMGQGDMHFGWMAAHPTLYLKKSIYEKYGLYKTNYRISADYELMVRLFAKNKVRIGYINEILIRMEHGGTSTNSLKSYFNGVKEAFNALRENNVHFALFATICRFIRVGLQFINK